MMTDNSEAMTGRALVAVLGLAGFISAADNWIVSPVLPAIAAGFGISIPLAGMVFTAYMIPYGAMQPVYGFLSDRWGKAQVLQSIVAGLALGTVGCALAGSLWTLCLWRAITGFFAAGIIAVSLALIGDQSAPTERHINVGRFMGMVFLGQGLSVGLGGLLANYVSWRASFVLFAAIAAFAFVLLRRLPKTPTQVQTRNFFAETKRVLLLPTGRIIFPLAFATGFLLLGCYSYLGAFLHEIMQLNYTQVGLVVMFYGFACLATGIWVGRIGRRFGEKKTVVLGGCIALTAIVLLAITNRWAVGWIATVALGVGYILIQSTLATAAFDVAPDAKGLPSALIGFGLFGGGGLGSAFCSWLLPLGGYASMWGILALGMLGFIVVACSVRWNRPPRPAP
jgi:predicted MFS family arabinose efflux permease